MYKLNVGYVLCYVFVTDYIFIISLIPLLNSRQIRVKLIAVGKNIYKIPNLKYTKRQIKQKFYLPENQPQI